MTFQLVSGQEMLSPSVPCQRWKDRSDRLLQARASAAFDPSIYAVDVVDESTARAFITQHHYSSSYPAAVCRVGLFGKGAELLGVAVFSVPMNQKVVPAHCGVAADQGVELGRLVLLDCDQAPRNTESFFLKRAFECLVSEKPKVRAVVSYCDPVPRVAADGTVRLRGHVGLVYQASNARYVGRGSPRTLHLLPDGTVLSPRTLSKIRLGEAGARSAEQALCRIGARRRRFGESPGEWLGEVLQGQFVRKIQHPGNFVYTFALGSKRDRKVVERLMAPAQAYPKQGERLTRSA